VDKHPGISQNATGVILPATEGPNGIPLAAASGSRLGNPERAFQFFSGGGYRGQRPAGPGASPVIPACKSASNHG